MKKSIILYLLLTLATAAHAQHDKDTSAIIQVSIDLPELQQFFSDNADGTKKPVYIMQRDLELPAQLQVRKFGQSVRLVSRREIVNHMIDCYFMFNQLEVDGGQAGVSYFFVHGTQDEPVYLDIRLTLVKQGDVWEIINKSIQ